MCRFSTSTGSGCTSSNEREAAREQTSTEALRSEVKKRLGLADWHVQPVPPRVLKGGGERSLEFEVAPGLIIPAVDRPGTEPGPTVMKLGADWKKEQTASHRGRLVLVDPRGMGKTSPNGESARNPSPFGRDWKDAYIVLAIDRPLLGQRVTDLLSMLEGLAAEPGERKHGFHLVGIGAAGPVVLHAALLDEHGLIKQVTVERSLLSWADVVERGLSRDQMGNVVPGVLQSYDLPDLAARLTPIPLTINSPVDASGEPVSQAVLERAYAQCARAYGPGGKLELRAVTSTAD